MWIPLIRSTRGFLPSTQPRSTSEFATTDQESEPQSLFALELLHLLL